MNNLEEELRQATQILEQKSMDYHNYDTAMGAPDSESFDSNMAFDDDPGVLNALGQIRHGDGAYMKPGQMTYDLQINYVNNGPPPGDPVLVNLYQALFNDGVFVGEDLVFTNAATDTATIVGETESYRASFERSRTEPFRIAFVRMEVVEKVQFAQRWDFSKRSPWGGSKANNLTPKTFITPEQFQLLRVDVPMGYGITSESGWSFNVLNTALEAAGGVQLTLFVDKLINLGRGLQNKNAKQLLTGPGIMNQRAVIANPSAVVNELARRGLM